MNLVQEFVQKDLLHQQKKRAQKDKSASVMHAIMSLQKNLDDSKESNEQFHFEMRKCKFCSFRTESRVSMQHHMETPHMKNFIYRCNFCEYETKIPQEVVTWNQPMNKYCPESVKPKIISPTDGGLMADDVLT